MKSLFAPVDNYCERIDATFWSEPFNAITNMAFIVVAWLLYREYRRLKKTDLISLKLIIIVAVVGVGSFIFHTFANTLGMFADIIPIIAYVCVYLCLSLYVLVEMKPAWIFVGLTAFVLGSLELMGLPKHLNFNGSASYFMCPLTLAVIALLLERKKHPAARSFFLAFVLFTISLIFRSLDMLICESFPLGTHFIWHMINSIVLYILTKAMMIHRFQINK